MPKHNIHRIGRAVAIGAALWFAPSTLVAADDADPQKTFEEVFGESWKRATSTGSTLDDAELARELAKSVKTITMPVSLIEVIVEKQQILCEKSSGALLPTIETIEILETKEIGAPRKLQLEAKVIALLERARTSADTAEVRTQLASKLLARLVPVADRQMEERKLDSAAAYYAKALALAKELGDASAKPLAAKFEAASAQQKQILEVDALEKRIEANDKDVEARTRLIHIHLVERDDPSAAIWFVAEGVDAKTAKLLPVAVKEGKGADAATLADLGGWYADLANDASAPAKPAMWRHARDYYDQFLKVYTTEDLLLAKAKLTLDQVSKKLAEHASQATAAANPTPAPATPGTPVTPTPTTPATPAGDLTVEINGPAVTEPERVDRLFQQQWRNVAKAYVDLGKEFVPIFDYESRYPSSAKETLAAMKVKLTVTKTERVGLIRKTVTIPPVPAEAEAAAMALPSFDVGSYGYVHSAEVMEVVGPEELVVRQIHLVDPATLAGAAYDQRQERDKLIRRQNEWNYSLSTMRLHGYPTAGLKPADRIGMTANRGKPLQIYIVQSEPAADSRRTLRSVAVLTSKIGRAEMEEKEFDSLLASRKLTRTDFVNLMLEAQRGSIKDALPNAIKRIEAKGAKLP